jgi:small subunit ribosomal protein S6
MSTTYETMYILRPDLSDEIVDGLVTKYQDLIRESGGEIIETQHRGKRRLAYLIDKHRDGIYIQMDFTAPGSTVATMERAMRLSEEVIRYLTIKQDPTAATESEAEEDEAEGESEEAA